jgi:hypothetical protein
VLALLPPLVALALPVLVPEGEPAPLLLPWALALAEATGEGLASSSVHSHAPATREVVSGGQDWQVAAPVALEKVPGAQGAHCRARVALANVPFAQGTRAPAGHAAPGGQPTHVKPQLRLP